MAISYVSSDFSTFGDTITNSPSFASVSLTQGQALLVGYVFRSNEAADIITPPTWNGQSLTLLRDEPVPAGTPEVRFKLYGFVANTTATSALAVEMTAYKVTTAAYVVYGTDQEFVWPPTVVSQMAWDTWSQPNLTATTALTGNLVVEFLGATGWDSEFIDNSASTWAPASSQTERLDQGSTTTPWPRVVIADKVATGSTQMQYTVSAEDPAYGHSLVVLVDGEASSPDTNIGLRLSVKDRTLGTPSNDTGYTVVVRELVNSTSILDQTASAAIVDGFIEFDSDLVGDLGDKVHVTIHKAGVDVNLDKNSAGYATVVDLETEDVS